MSSVAKWIVGLVGCVGLVVAGVFVSRTPFADALLNGDLFAAQSEREGSQVTKAIDRTSEVALVSLGIQGIERRTDTSTFMGVEIPGSERAVFLQYEFTGKLGIDGRKVEIEQNEEGSYTLRMPEFIFIGFSNPSFRVAAENNGVLSWTTPEIDTTEMTNSILSDEAMQKYVDANTELLTEQARAFYGGIFAGIDPQIELNFVFSGGN